MMKTQNHLSPHTNQSASIISNPNNKDSSTRPSVPKAAKQDVVKTVLLQQKT